MKTSVLIIGAGIIGTAIARELSRYTVKVALIEKETDVAFGGPTKANTAIIHAGYDDRPGTLSANLCQRGNRLWSRLASELNIPFERIGSFVIAFEGKEKRVLKDLLERGGRNSVRGLKIIEDQELFEMEPNLNKDTAAGLYAPTAGVVSPYEAAIGLAENARANGVSICFGTKATGLTLRSNGIEAVLTSKGKIDTRYVVNAAGLFADQISSLAGINEFRIIPRKGEYVIYDKDLAGMVNHALFPVPTSISKGITVTPTVDGNIIAGPTAQDVQDKNDFTTTLDGLEEVLDGAHRLVPRLSSRSDAIIASFTGLRPQPTTDDFIIKPYQKPYGFINVAGMKSPGLSSAPAIAKMVVGILKEEGLTLHRKDGFSASRTPIIHPLRDFHPAKTEEAITSNPVYGHVVCRCEYVTEAEIVEAVRRGATTLDGVKYRTRAGMGRCQGGFCTPHVIRIISRELGVPVQEVTKRGGDSGILPFPAKHLLVGDER